MTPGPGACCLFLLNGACELDKIGNLLVSMYVAHCEKRIRKRNELNGGNKMIEWVCKDFQQLTTEELFKIYKSRVDVFVVEQTCPYPEVDNLDLLCYHLLGWEQQKLAAYARIIIEKNDVRIGRILVTKEFRNQGLGKKLLAQAIKEARALNPERKIVIQAQAYLENFYHSFGFKNTSEEYPEDGIPHIDMELV